MALLSGYIVVTEHAGETYHIKVRQGVRGINIPVSAELIDGQWRISLQGKPMTVVEVMKLVPQQKQVVQADFSIKPSDVSLPLSDSIWLNREKEVVAGNLCKLSQFKNGDCWVPFTWDDYVSYCSHTVTSGEHEVLEGFVQDGYLEKDEGIYAFTKRIIGVYMQYV